VVLAELGLAIGAARRAWHFPASTAGERPVFAALRDAGLYDASGVPPRTALPPWIVRQNAGLLYKWADVAGYNALTLDRVWMFLHEDLGLTPSLDENTYPSPRIYDSGPFPYDSMNIVASWNPGNGAVVFRSHADADPRAWLAPAARRVADWHEAVTAMAAGHDFHRIALVETDTTGLASSTSTDGEDADRVGISSFHPERVVLETESAAPALLVLAEAWYPGWTATIDGAPAPCVPANAWMRAVEVPAGTHRVELRFRSRWLGPGAGLALLTAGVLGLLVRRQRRTFSPETDAS
jgi:hypothetical protein